ncbi:MAG TPA: hypothetical protein VKU92_03900 [Acidimicrobiales bacterium]|nr:hypothetical protein [Acidimicrobiales bacterium]
MDDRRRGRGPGRVRAARKVAAAAVAAAVLGACSSTGGGASPKTGKPASDAAPVVSPSAARAILGPTMATNNRANARLDSSLLASYEAGSAFALDNATYEADRAAHFRPPPAPFTVDLMQLALTRQTAYPAKFVAEGIQHSLSKSAPAAATSCGTILTFERASSRSPWRIVLEPSLKASQLPRLASGSGGFAPAVDQARRRVADGLPEKVVQALLTEETTGRLGPFRPSDFTDPCGGIPNPRQDVTSAEAAGFSQRDLFRTAARPDTTAFALAGGGTLVMFTLRFEDQLLATEPSNLIDWSHPSLSQSPGEAWTYFLSAGTYSEVSESGELEMAVELSPSGTSWRFVGSYGGVTSVTGHRATPSSAPPTTSQLAAAFP